MVASRANARPPFAHCGQRFPIKTTNANAPASRRMKNSHSIVHQWLKPVQETEEGLSARSWDRRALGRFGKLMFISKPG